MIIRLAFGTAIRWASLTPDGYRPNTRPDISTFLGYTDETVLKLNMVGSGHVTERIARSLNDSGIGIRQTPWERFQGTYDPKGYIVLTTKSALPIKDWRPDGWTELERRLLDAGYRVQWETKGDLWELERQLRGARLVIGVDTGSLHLADYMGIPVLGLYGITLPHEHGPLGTDARTIHCPGSLGRLSVEAVYSTAIKILES